MDEGDVSHSGEPEEHCPRCGRAVACCNGDVDACLATAAEGDECVCEVCLARTLRTAAAQHNFRLGI